MKCIFPPGENVCKRCKTGNHDCIFEGRMPRSALNKREYLLAQMKQKDAIIESLLKQVRFHEPSRRLLALKYDRVPTFPVTQSGFGLIQNNNNPDFGTLSNEAYRTETSSSDGHRWTTMA
ncbi:hypothetical protein V8E53_008703 [Lactarius tabidus]